jgi:hypothetical protein
MKNTIIRLFDIEYDAPKSVQKELEKEFIVSAVDLGWEDGDDLTEIIEGLGADWISDQTDWLVNGFEYNILIETDFYQLKREFVWSSGDANFAYNSYFQVMECDEEDCNIDEIGDFLLELERDEKASAIALEYGELAGRTGNSNYIDEGAALI